MCWMLMIFYFPLTVHVDTRHAACRRKSEGVLPARRLLFKCSVLNNPDMLLNDMSTPSIFSSFRGTISPPSVFTLRGRPRLVACPVNAWIAIEKWYSAFCFAI